MSKSDGQDFNVWVDDQIASTDGFTAIVMLLALSEQSVEPVSCSYVDMIGDETRWDDLKGTLDDTGQRWDAVAIFPESAPGGGPLVDVVAKARLQARIDEVMADGMALNDSGMFDALGRAIRIAPVDVN